jgi:hypothetical protein
LGAVGLRGAFITTLLEADGFCAHSSAVSVQNALTLVSLTVTTSPTFAKFKLLVVSFIAGKVALTTAASSHVHVDLSALEKVKRVLQDHEVFVNPALSVSESKVMRKYSPPFENREETIFGASKEDDSDSSWTVVDEAM